MGLGSRSARHETAGAHKHAVESQVFSDFKPKDRVMTVDGVPGTVTAVREGPYPGTEDYEVALDNGLGGGFYTVGQLQPVAATTASHEHEAVGVHVASDDYPELGSILHDRPPIERVEHYASRGGGNPFAVEAAVHPEPAFELGHPHAVYLRFGDWSKDERSENHATGWREEGVSTYELDKHGDPVDPDPDFSRGEHEHDEYCDEDCDKQFNDEYGNDALEEMRGRVHRAEKDRSSGRDHASTRPHLVKGDFIGIGHDGEPLLHNVKRVGDWINDRHRFIPTADKHHLAEDHREASRQHAAAENRFDFQHEQTNIGGLKFPRQVDTTAHHPETGEQVGRARYFPPKRRGGPISIDEIKGHAPGVASAMLNEIEGRHPGSRTVFLHEVKRNNNNPDVTGHAHENAGGPSDWDTHYPNLKDTVHRGFSLRLPSHSARTVNSSANTKDEHLAELHAAIRQGSAIGTHWTEDEHSAQVFAHNAVSDHRTDIPVVLHAATPARKDIETRQHHLYRGGVFPYGDPHSSENEVPIRKGRKVAVTGISWRPDVEHPDADEHGWLHHTYPEAAHHTAALMNAAAEPPTGEPMVQDVPSACSYCGSDALSVAGDNGRNVQARCDTCGGMMSSWGGQFTPELIGDPSNHPSALADPDSGGVGGVGNPYGPVPVRRMNDADHTAAHTATGPTEIDVPGAKAAMHEDYAHYQSTRGNDRTEDPAHQYPEIGQHLRSRGIHADFGGIDANTARLHDAALSHLHNLYPGVLTHVDTAHDIPLGDEFAHSSGSSITFSERAMKRRGQLEMHGRGGHVSGHLAASGAIGITAHEFGHAFEHHVGLGNIGISQLAAKLHPRVGSGRAMQLASKKISEYAHKGGPHELVAEAFADRALNGSNAAPLSHAIFEKMHELYHEKHSREASLRTASDEGHLHLYHRTSLENAEAINNGAPLRSMENTGETYWSNRHEGYGEGYGDGVVHIRIPEHLAELDDEFPDGEQHFRVHPKHIRPEHIVREASLHRAASAAGGRIVHRDPSCPVCRQSPTALSHTAALPHPNPYGGEVWYHGTDFDPNEGYSHEPHDEGDRPGGELERDDPYETESGERIGKHWNTDLGTHFSGMHRVAHDFADHGNPEHARIAHVHLHMTNPFHVEDENHFANHAIDYAKSQGHHFLPKDDESHRRFINGEHEEADWDDKLSRYQYLDWDREHRKMASEIDRGDHRKHPMEEKEMWLAGHPDRDQVTGGYIKHLQSKGHDGVIYGNSHEGPDKNKCAIAFPNTRHTIKHWEYVDHNAQKRYDSQVGPHGWNPHQMTLPLEFHSLKALGSLDKEGLWHFTAAWSDVRNKAKRLRSEGSVRITVASGEGVGGEVKGDHNIYETLLTYVPGSQKVAYWQCGCKWAAYAWGRSPAYKRFEGRMCSHALAMQFEAQARGMFGKTVEPDAQRPKWMKQRTPVVIQHERDTKTDLTRRAVPPGNMRRTHGSLTFEAFMATGVHGSGPMPNPYHDHHEWYHGTTRDIDELDPHQMGHSPASLGSSGPQTNKLLGVHFSALHQVAHDHFARSSYRPNRVFHAELHMSNPIHFEDEGHLVQHLFRWGAENHPDFHDEKHNDNQRWNGSPDSEDLLKRDQEYPRDGDNWKHFVRHGMERYLQFHPKQGEIAKAYVDHLHDSGHDGITYGNDVEGPKLHYSAIATHPDQIRVTHVDKMPPTLESPGDGQVGHGHIAQHHDEDDQLLQDVEDYHTGGKGRFGAEGQQGRGEHTYAASLSPAHHIVVEALAMGAEPVDVMTDMMRLGIGHAEAKSLLRQAMGVEASLQGPTQPTRCPDCGANISSRLNRCPHCGADLSGHEPTDFHEAARREQPNYGVFWHGTPSGDLRGGPYGLHVGTEESARQALHARIGEPAEGTWDGTREYGKTKLKGIQTQHAEGKIPTGLTRNGPYEDHYPSGNATYGDDSPIPMDAKPDIFPVRIKGPMTNHPQTPHPDWHANGYMKAQIGRGRARSGYFYTNEAEDEGSISAVVPNGDHLERLPRGQHTAMPSRKHTPPADLYFDSYDAPVGSEHHDEAEESHPGWSHHLLRAHRSGLEEDRGHPFGMTGMIYYSRTPEGAEHPGVAIHDMRVYPGHGGQGIGSAMQDELRRLHPHHMIDHGSRTDDGAGWHSQYEDPGDPRLDLSHPDNAGTEDRYRPTPLAQHLMTQDLRGRRGAKKSEVDGPTHAGVVLKARDTGRILMLQRSLEDEDDPAAGCWEFPGGGIEEGDQTTLHAGIREWEEEVGQKFPTGGALHHVWASPNGIYHGHVVVIPEERQVELHNGRVTTNPDDPDGEQAEQAAWWDPEHAKKNPALRPECKDSPWKEIVKAGGQKTAVVHEAEDYATYRKRMDEQNRLRDESLKANPPKPVAHKPEMVDEGPHSIHDVSRHFDWEGFSAHEIEHMVHNPERAQFTLEDVPVDSLRHWGPKRSRKIPTYDQIVGDDDDERERMESLEHGYSEGHDIPPIVVVRHGDKHLIADGSHRAAIHARSGETHIRAFVTPRTKFPTKTAAAGDSLQELEVQDPGYTPPLHSNSQNPASTGFATSQDPPEFDNANGLTNGLLPSNSYDAALHDEPEGALPFTDGADDDVDPDNPFWEVDPGALHRQTTPEVSSVDTSATPNQFTGSVEDIVAKFQATAGARTLNSGSAPSSAGPSDSDIAGMAKRYLSLGKEALKQFNFQEQQELINEGARDNVMARNADKLDIANTHYSALEEALAAEESVSDPDDLYV